MRVFLALSALAWVGSANAQDEKQQLQQRLEDQVGTRWIYDDLDKGFEAAKNTGKPLLVVIRCVK
jgi:hypothetical protein